MNTLINRSGSSIALKVKKIVQITNPISGKKIQNTNIKDKEFMKEILENFFPNIENKDLIYSENKVKYTSTKSKKS